MDIHMCFSQIKWKVKVNHNFISSWRHTILMINAINSRNKVCAYTKKTHDDIDPVLSTLEWLPNKHKHFKCLVCLSVCLPYSIENWHSLIWLTEDDHNTALHGHLVIRRILYTDPYSQLEHNPPATCTFTMTDTCPAEGNLYASCLLLATINKLCLFIGLTSRQLVPRLLSLLSFVHFCQSIDFLWHHTIRRTQPLNPTISHCPPS